MPPIVKSNTATRLTTTRLSGAQPATALTDPLQAPAIPGTLLGPGHYHLRNVHSSVPLSAWAQQPVTGAVHVARQGDQLVETWVMFSTYRPVSQASGDRVVVTALSVGSPGMVADFMQSLSTQWSLTGAQTSTWSYGANDVYDIQNAPWVQLMPGGVELQVLICGIGANGVLGAPLGKVVIPPVAGLIIDWTQVTYHERWHVLPDTLPVAPGQSFLLDPFAQPIACPGNTLVRTWSVSYAPISGQNRVEMHTQEMVTETPGRTSG